MNRSDNTVHVLCLVEDDVHLFNIPVDDMVMNSKKLVGEPEARVTDFKRSQLCGYACNSQTRAHLFGWSTRLSAERKKIGFILFFLFWANFPLQG
jgi:hypothetical protein